MRRIDPRQDLIERLHLALRPCWRPTACPHEHEYDCIDTALMPLVWPPAADVYDRLAEVAEERVCPRCPTDLTVTGGRASCVECGWPSCDGPPADDQAHNNA